MHGTAFERLVDGGIQPRVENDDLRTDPFLDKMLDLVFWIFSLFSFYMMHTYCKKIKSMYKKFYRGRTASSSIIASAANATTMKRWCFVKRNARFVCLCEYIYIHTYEFYNNNNTLKAALVRGRSRVVLFKKYTPQVKKILLSKTCLCLLVIRFNTVVVVVFRRPAFL